MGRVLGTALCAALGPGRRAGRPLRRAVAEKHPARRGVRELRARARFVNGRTIRPLRDGDTHILAAPFHRMSDHSRERRFDRDSHVLVGYVDGDTAPVGIARLVREGASAEIAFAIADDHQGRGVASILANELAADARAAGITRLIATICSDNPGMVALLRRLVSSLEARWLGREREFVVALEK